MANAVHGVDYAGFAAEFEEADVTTLREQDPAGAGGSNT